MSLPTAMARRIEMWPIERLIPYARNARTHSDAQIAKIAASMLEFGVNNPLLVDSHGGLIAGHGRLLAARKLGLEQLPVVVLDHLTEMQRRAYILADNRLAELAGWDTELLALELSELECDIDINLMGFAEEDLHKMLDDTAADLDAETDSSQQEESKDEPVPDVPVQPVSASGDVWLLGRHRLICGDSTKTDTLQRLLGGDKAALCFSSPPYGNQRDYTQGISDWDGLMRGVYGKLADFMTPKAQILVNLGLIHRDNEVQPYWDEWIEWMRLKGWKRFAWYVWNQGIGLPGDWHGRLAPAFEFIFHFNREPRKANKFVPCKCAGSIGHLDAEGRGTDIRNRDGCPGQWTHAGRPVQEFRIPDSVISIGRQSGPVGKDIDHPAVFPVALPEHIMLAYSDENEIVYEPFSGSGSSLLAGERCKRKVCAAEIAPEYVDVAVIRFTRAHPDIPAILESTGQSFEEVRHARRSEH